MNMNKGIIFLMMGIITMSGVSAINLDNVEETKTNYCTEQEIINMGGAIKEQDLTHDFNGDGRVNLIDVGIFTRNCYAEPEEEIVTKPKPKKSSSMIVMPQPDGSTSYFVKGTAFQLEKGIVLQWTKGYIGTIQYKDKTIMINDGIGINIK